MGAPADPYSAAFQAGGQVLSKALDTKPAGPSTANLSGTFQSDADFSGWNINFGNGTLDSTLSKTKTESATPGGAGGGGVGPGQALAAVGVSADWQTIGLVGLGLVGLWAVLRRRR
jgi:hypothetical protein